MKARSLAHSENSAGVPHTLKEHLLGVRQRALAFSPFSRLEKLLELVALLHDLGKYLPAFQRYLREGGARGSVPHARWGALLARILNAEEASFAIDGHHAGLPDHNVWAQEHTFASIPDKQQLLELVAEFQRDTGLTDKDLVPLRENAAATAREKDVRTRLLFSCLTDADWLDTEEHFSPEISGQRQHLALAVDDAIARVDATLARLEARSTPINTLRTRARFSALKKACMPPGFFSINLPTGLGKTLTSLRWGLEHARANSLERIIIVLPYTNIIDQTALRLKDILGSHAVLEHHSSYVPAKDEKECDERRKLACENWDHPLIVTTTVQFFETLFSNAPGKCRKLHNICKSVVILDEVQTLRKDLVLPTLDMLQDMQGIMGTSFVFCTATMPAFEKNAYFPSIERITELVEDAKEFFEKTRRVHFTLLESLRPVQQASLEAALQAQTQSALVIGNTKKLARALYAAAKGWQGWDAVYHLSTSMCPHHRKQHMQRISAAIIDRSKKILVFSTQLVEAGVDFDFPCVFRELSPLESIIQAAGRCNREGRLPEKGNVILFQLENATYPDVFYKTQAQHTYMLISEAPDCLYDYATFKAYYSQIMGLYVNHAPITYMREQQNFATVADQYNVIASNMQTLFIWDYNEDSQKIYDMLRRKERHRLPLSRDDFRAMQQYSVQVYETDLRKSAGCWEQAYSGILVWNGGYNEHTGLDVAPQNADTLIV